MPIVAKAAAETPSEPNKSVFCQFLLEVPLTLAQGNYRLVAEFHSVVTNISRFGQVVMSNKAPEAVHFIRRRTSRGYLN